MTGNGKEHAVHQDQITPTFNKPTGESSARSIHSRLGGRVRNTGTPSQEQRDLRSRIEAAKGSKAPPAPSRSRTLMLQALQEQSRLIKQQMMVNAQYIKALGEEEARTPAANTRNPQGEAEASKSGRPRRLDLDDTYDDEEEIDYEDETENWDDTEPDQENEGESNPPRRNHLSQGKSHHNSQGNRSHKKAGQNPEGSGIKVAHEAGPSGVQAITPTMEVMLREWLKKQDNSPKKNTSAMDAFAGWIKNSPVARGRLPPFDAYSGTTCATSHVGRFEVQMSLFSNSEAIKCKALVSTFQGKALSWLLAHGPGSITGYEMLRTNFLNAFAGSGETARPKEDLIRMRQQPGESTISYITRFQAMTTQIVGLESRDIELCFMGGLSSAALKAEFSLRKPDGVKEMYETAMAIAGTEEVSQIIEPPKRSVKERIEFKSEPVAPSSPVRGRNRARRTDAYRETFTEFTAPRETVMRAVELPPPPPMGGSARKRNHNQFCTYHDDYGHDTEDCRHLKQALQDKVDAGKLQNWVARKGNHGNRPARPRAENNHREDNQPA